MIHQPSPAERVACVGVPGEGKSVFRARKLAGIFRVILWNPMGDENIGEVLTVSDFIAADWGRFLEGSLRLTIEPDDFSEFGLSDEFNTICNAAEEIGDLHFAIEEPGLVMSPTRVPESFNKLCIRGRHSSVSMSVYGQRFHQFPLIYRGTASEIIAFRQSDPDDVRDFDKRIAPAISPVPLNTLPPFHFVRFTPEEGPVYHSPIPFSEMGNQAQGR